MFTEIIQPRFSETDALGHINNTVLPVWFEGCRNAIFQLFTPDLAPKQWRLILARFQLEFQAELFYGQPVQIRTSISRIGNSSFEVSQQAWQQDRCCVSGSCVLVHYDFALAKSQPIPELVRLELAKHLVADALGQTN